MSDTKPLIAVVGATGRQGGSVVDALLRSGKWRVRGLSRNTESAQAKALAAKGVEMVQCHVSNNPEQLVDAFKGAYGVFAMTNFWDPELNQDSQLEQQQGRTMADAAAKAGVHHYIWSGLQDVDKATGGALNLSHYAGKYQVEHYVRTHHKDSFPVQSFVYVGFYFQNVTTFFQPTIEADGALVFRQPLYKHTTLPLFDVNDTGNVVAAIFDKPETYNGESVPIVAQNLTVTQMCEAITKVKGRAARHEPQDFAEWAKDLSTETADNMRWYNDYAPIHEARHAEITAKVYPAMATFEAWLAESSWLAQ